MYFATYKGTGIEYLIVIMLVCLSGNPVFSAGDRADQLLVAVFILFTILILVRKRAPLTLTYVTVGFLFLTISLVQAVSFAFLPLVTIAGFMVRLSLGYEAVNLVEDFPRVYINVLFYTCILSLCFYVPQQLAYAVGYNFKSLFASLPHWVYGDGDFHIVIYSFQDRVHRNAAFFWEPGAFAGYILLALIFLGLQKESYTDRFYQSRFVITTITLLTTLSTMGFLVLPVVLALHYKWFGKTAAARLQWLGVAILLLPFLGLGIAKIWELKFMKEKITAQYEQTEARSGTWDNTRYGNLIFDWEYIERRPILGWGLNEKTRLALHAGRYVSPGKGNGFSGFIHSFGFVGMAIFVLFTWKGLYKISGNNLPRSSLAMLAILLSLNGEQFLQHPLFLGLMFLRKAPEKKRQDADGSADAETSRHSNFENIGAMRY